jgi:ABC-2 type transport system permease protein
MLSKIGSTGKQLVNLGFAAHYKSISRGVIDSRDLIYFLSVIILFLALTHFKLKSRRW